MPKLNRRRVRDQVDFAAFATATALLAIVLALASHESAASTVQDPTGFAGISLGMTLKDWKSEPFPSGRARPVCDDDPAAARALLQPANASPDTIVCAYFSQYGRYMLPEPVKLDSRLQATHLRLTFHDDRLTGIEYRTSANQYDDLIAKLSTLYGPATSTVRDTIKTEAGVFPRVRQTWTTPSRRIELVDPVAPFTDLGIKVVATPPGRAS